MKDILKSIQNAENELSYAATLLASEHAREHLSCEPWERGRAHAIGRTRARLGNVVVRLSNIKASLERIEKAREMLKIKS
jgi:hypothetical protein